jgi:hypothetical protein
MGKCILTHTCMGDSLNFYGFGCVFYCVENYRVY